MRARDAYATGWSSCCNTAPRPFELSSTDSLVGLCGSKYFSTGAFMASCFSAWKLCSWSLSQCHLTFFLVILSVVMQLVTSLE